MWGNDDTAFTRFFLSIRHADKIGWKTINDGSEEKVTIRVYVKNDPHNFRKNELDIWQCIESEGWAHGSIIGIEDLSYGDFVLECLLLRPTHETLDAMMSEKDMTLSLAERLAAEIVCAMLTSSRVKYM